MHKRLAMPTSAGYLELVTIWEFMKDVMVERIHPQVAEQYRTMHMREMNLSRRFAHPDTPTCTEVTHLLKQNPSSVLVELKKTTTLKELKSKNVKLLDLLHDYVHKSMFEFGNPTHFFPVGQNRYALICKEDVRLVITETYKQSLVCTRPERNFILYVPNLKVDL